MAAAEDSAWEERRNRIALRRVRRFFSAGGICDGYERRGDPLIEFHTIARLIAATVPGVTIDQVKERFVLGVQLGAFPMRDYGPRRRAVRDLVNLHQFSVFESGQYLLRPSVLIVELIPWAIRSSRSIWVGWIQSQGWPVPPELWDKPLQDAKSIVPAKAKRQTRHSEPPELLTQKMEEIQREHLKTAGVRPLTRRQMEQRVPAARPLISEAYAKMRDELQAHPGRPK